MFIVVNYVYQEGNVMIMKLTMKHVLEKLKKKFIIILMIIKDF